MARSLQDFQQMTYYQILNLERTATSDQIKEAYKEIAKLYHPDSNFYAEIIADPLTQDEHEIFKQITLAYTTLLHPEKRKAYDEKLAPNLDGWDKEESNPGENKAPPRPRSPTSDSLDIQRFQRMAQARAQAAAREAAAAPPPPVIQIDFRKALIVLTALAFMAATATIILLL